MQAILTMLVFILYPILSFLCGGYLRGLLFRVSYELFCVDVFCTEVLYESLYTLTLYSIMGFLTMLFSALAGTHLPSPCVGVGAWGEAP